MPDEENSPEAPPGAEPAHEVRFRAATADGKRIEISAPFRLRKKDGPPPSLGVPFFGHAEYRPGDKASLVVRADGVRGLPVTFIVEKGAGGVWEKADEIKATFDQGSACATWVVPTEPPRVPVPYRVRAVTKFGDEKSDPVTVLAPNAELKNPAWSHARPQGGAHFAHGDEAGMRVEARGLDGRKVKFVVERQQAGKWEAHATVEAVVQGGEASGKLVIQHPALAGKAPTRADLEKARPLELRFHAELA